MEKESDKQAPVHPASAQVELVPKEPLEEPSLSFSDSEEDESPEREANNEEVSGTAEDALIKEPLPESLPNPQYFQIVNELLKTKMNEELNKLLCLLKEPPF